jgi:sterol 3beta-glucosyltransferase
MSDRNADQITQVVVAALRRSKQRGILGKGWGGLSDAGPGDDILEIDYVPFDWLFLYMAAIVHHGGIGTVGLGLRAGVPAISIPVLGDQFFWGHRLAELGVGPKPIPRNRLSTESLADAITVAVRDPAMRRQAALLGQRIRAENGIQQAVDAFHRQLAR